MIIVRIIMIFVLFRMHRAHAVVPVPVLVEKMINVPSNNALTLILEMTEIRDRSWSVLGAFK